MLVLFDTSIYKIYLNKYRINIFFKVLIKKPSICIKL